MRLFILQFVYSITSFAIDYRYTRNKTDCRLEFEFHGVAPQCHSQHLIIKRHFVRGALRRTRDMYSLSPARCTPPRDICRAESAPSMWSGGVKIQIENHLANLPVVPSVNKFRFTRVGGLRVMDPCARREARRFNLHKGGRAYLRFLYVCDPRGIFSEASGRIFLSLDRAEIRVRNIRPCNLLNRR